MSLVLVGVVVTGICMAVSASQIMPQLRQYFRKSPFGKRTGPKVVTKIQVQKENQNEP